MAAQSATTPGTAVRLVTPAGAGHSSDISPTGRYPVFGLGATELLIILAIVVVLFGARRLPEIGSGLGRAIKNFKTGISGKDEIDVTPTKPDEVSDRGGPQA
jgi:sec-independent protein translocase protein TatA